MFLRVVRSDFQDFLSLSNSLISGVFLRRNVFPCKISYLLRDNVLRDSTWISTERWFAGRTKDTEYPHSHI